MISLRRAQAPKHGVRSGISGLTSYGMEKLLAPAPIGQGELTDQWERFKREFSQNLTAVGKYDASEQVKLDICLWMVGPRVNDMYETR